MNKAVLLAAVVSSAAVSASGSGFSLFQGDTTGCADAAGSIAKGGRAGDLYYNPATMTAVTGTVAQVGVFSTKPHLKIDGSNAYTGEKNRTAAKKEWFAIPHFYFTHQADDDFWVGLGLFSRAGLGDEFPAGWPGRYNSTKVEITTIDLSPTVAWRAADWISVGAGITLQYFEVVLEQDIDAAGIAGQRNYNDPSPSPYDVHQRMHGDDDLAVGWDLGVLLEPVDRLHVGLAYHSEIELHAKGHARYSAPDAVRAAFPGCFRDTDVKATLSEPAYVMSAIAYDLTDRLTLGVNVTWSGWSCWDKIEIHEKEGFLPGHDVLLSKKNWNDVWRYSVGGSYKLADEWTLLASFTYDDSPIEPAYCDYIVPADTREIYAVGLSWERGDLALDAMYFFENINDMGTEARVRDGMMTGKYTGGFSHAFGFSASYRF